MTVLETANTTAGSGAGYPTVASRAREWAVKAPDQLAMREKDFGIWHEFTWAQVWDTVLDAAHALQDLGLEVGDRMSIHAEDRLEWIILDLATVANRGITVGLYPTNPHAEVEYTLNDCGSKIHFAEDQEQIDKVLDLPRERFPSVEKIIYVEPRGVRGDAGYQDDRLLYWDDFIALGQQHRAANGSAVDERMQAAEADDVMTLVYTSGTTGPPKGAMITNANVEFAIDVIVNTPQRTPDGKRPGPHDHAVTYLPLCHVAERVFSTWSLVSAGVVLNFAEAPEAVFANLREVQPTLFFAVPRIWEKLHAGVIIRGSDSSRFKKLILSRSLKVADWIGESRVANNGNWTPATRVAYTIFNFLVFRALKERLGLRRVRYAGTGAAPIAPEVIQFFMGIGLDIYELYGMTENSAIATANLQGRVKVGTVGEPYPQMKDGLRIDETTGEIQTKHAGVFAGYWGKPEKTAETFTADGWLMTGDVGEWVDGTHIRIVDRIKHIIITAGGKNISPSEIENTLKVSPFINEAMVIGDRRKYLTALIGIELDTVGNWALKKNIPYTTYRDLSEKPEVLELIQKEVDRTNEKFARVEGIKKFRLLPKELDHEDGEMTATMKLKRSSMEDLFSELVESMY
ncbi:MAG: AMP-binding protein [Acidimicrobiales bacterium]|nr:AMP-binding protein [Acidimicrobiales bacterium]